MPREQDRLHPFGNLPQLVQSPRAVVEQSGSRKVARESTLPRCKEEQPILEVRHIRKLQDFVVVTDQFITQLLRWNVDEDQVLISQPEYSGKLYVFTLRQVLYRQPFLLLSFYWVQMDLDVLLPRNLLVITLKLWLPHLKALHYLLVSLYYTFL